MRRVLWTAGVGLVGFGLGWFGQVLGQETYTIDLSFLALLAVFTLWGCSIGYGFGNIFGQIVPRRSLILYWTITLALGALLFSGFVPFASYPAKLPTAAAIGALVGALVGTVHLRQVRRKFRAAYKQGGTLHPLPVSDNLS
jgi:hypothetical protein